MNAQSKLEGMDNIRREFGPRPQSQYVILKMNLVDVCPPSTKNLGRYFADKLALPLTMKSWRIFRSKCFSICFTRAVHFTCTFFRSTRETSCIFASSSGMHWFCRHTNLEQKTIFQRSRGSQFFTRMYWGYVHNMLMFFNKHDCWCLE